MPADRIKVGSVPFLIIFHSIHSTNNNNNFYITLLLVNQGRSLNSTTSKATTITSKESPTIISRLSTTTNQQMPRARSRSPNPQAVNTQWANEESKGKQSSTSTRNTSNPSTPTDGKPPAKRKSSSYSDVGRHSNDWLFNGFSVKDTAHSILKRKDSD
jgi:hypothetical protein